MRVTIVRGNDYERRECEVMHFADGKVELLFLSPNAPGVRMHFWLRGYSGRTLSIKPPELKHDPRQTNMWHSADLGPRAELVRHSAAHAAGQGCEEFGEWFIAPDDLAILQRRSA